MRSKYVNESISAFLTPKSDDHIAADIRIMSKDELNKVFNRAVVAGNVKNVELLLIAGADVNGMALHWAACNNHNEIVEMLITAGANVNLRNTDGCTALHYAAYDGNSDVVKTLLNAGANVNVENYDGFTALYFASRNGFYNLVKILKNYGAKK